METEIEKRYKAARVKIAKESGDVNILSVPRILKVVINSGTGRGDKDPTLQEDVYKILEKISGQKPVLRKAKKSISNFSVREGMPVGVSVTLRGKMMWIFLDKFVSLVLARIRDFRGLNKKNIDGAGNLNIGITEHMIFLEIDPNEVQKGRGLQVTVVTDLCSTDDAYKLYKEIGFPFIE